MRKVNNTSIHTVKIMYATDEPHQAKQAVWQINMYYKIIHC